MRTKEFGSGSFSPNQVNLTHTFVVCFPIIIDICTGKDKNAYFHEMFLRGKSFLCRKIKRMKVKGEGGRKPSSPGSEPDFYSMAPLPPIEIVSREDVEMSGSTIPSGMLESSGAWPATASALGDNNPLLQRQNISSMASLPSSSIPNGMQQQHLGGGDAFSNLALEMALARRAQASSQLGSFSSVALAQAMLQQQQQQSAFLAAAAPMQHSMEMLLRGGGAGGFNGGMPYLTGAGAGGGLGGLDAGTAAALSREDEMRLALLRKAYGGGGGGGGGGENV